MHLFQSVVDGVKGLVETIPILFNKDHLLTGQRDLVIQRIVPSQSGSRRRLRRFRGRFRVD